MTSPQTPVRKSSPVFLATTAIEDCWNTSGKIVFLSEACRRYSRAKAWCALDAETLPDLWDDPQRRKESYRYINDLYERILPRLGSCLNDIHGESHGERYWRIVIGHWLYHYLTVQFDRYVHLVRALEIFPTLETMLLADDCHVTPRHTLEFMQRTATDSYNFQICSRILEFLGKDESPRVAIRQDPFPSAQALQTRASVLPRNMAWSMRVFLSALLKRVSPAPIVLHNSYFSRRFELRLAAKSKGAIVPSFLLDHDLPGMQTDPGMRKKLATLFFPQDRFEALLERVIPRDIPHCFVERYVDIARGSRLFPGTPRAIFSANSWFYNEAFKQWAGKCSERGALLLVSQHGGGHFGLGSYFPQEDQELSIADRYYTWGWRPESPSRDKAMPLAANLLAGRKPMPPDNRKIGILYVATAEPRYLRSLQNTIGHFVRYLEWQRRFFEAVPPLSKRKIRARLYPVDYGWDIRDRWLDHSPGVPIEDTARPFLESLEDCRLYVSDHLGTTFHEAMAADRPTILFFDTEMNPLRSEVLPWINALRSSGILHDTPERAAQTVDLAYADVERWWNDTQRQAARESFCAQFALTTSDPVGDWLNEFINLTSSGKGE